MNFRRVMPGFFMDQAGRLHDLRDMMTKTMGPNWRTGGTNAPATKPGSAGFKPDYKFVDGKLRKLNPQTGQYE